MCWTRATSLSVEPAAPSQARRSVRGLIEQQYGDLPDLVADLNLVISELVTNSLQASATAIEFDLEAHRDRVILSVIDDAPGQPTRGMPSESSLSGRGLAIVAAIAEDWGVRARDPGKVVWARLAVPVGSPMGFECGDPALDTD